MFMPEQKKPSIFKRMKWFFFGRPKIEFQKITMPIIEADRPNLNRDIFIENSLKSKE